MKLKPNDVRAEIPILRQLIYLDSASVCPPPRPVVEAMDAYYLEYPFNYRVGIFGASSRATDVVDRCRDDIARFIRASPDEIVFTKNTTEAINTVAQGMGWNQGDEVIITRIEHQSNIIPWIRIADRHGIVLRYAEANSEGFVDPKRIEALITKKTKLISVCEVSNIYGSIQSVDEIGEIADKHAISFLVDAAQSAGRIHTDVSGSNSTFTAFCGRKSLMGPQGIGFLHGKRDALAALEPLTTGSLAAQVTSRNRFAYSGLPFRFEAGVVNGAGVAGIGAAVNYIKDIGVQRIRSHMIRLTEYLVRRLGEIKGVSIYGPIDVQRQAGIVSWNLAGVTPDRLARKLWKAKRLAVASGDQGSRLAIEPLGVEGVVRTSLHYFNLQEDIDVLVDGLEICRNRT